MVRIAAVGRALTRTGIDGEVAVLGAGVGERVIDGKRAAAGGDEKGEEGERSGHGGLLNKWTEGDRYRYDRSVVPSTGYLPSSVIEVTS